MRRCRTEWLLAPCIISVLLISPTVCEGLLVGASNISPPALTPLVIKQVDDLVEHAWLKCGLDKKSLQDVKNYFNYDHVLDILHRISDNKDASPVIEQGTSPLTPEIKQTLLICLSKQSFEVEKNLPDGYIKTLIAAIRRELMLGLAANQAVKSVPGKPTESASSETTPTKKAAVPPTKSVAEKDKYGMLTTTIGLSLIAVALLGVFFCIYHEIQSSAYDNKTLLDLTNSFSSSELNQMDVNKLGVFSLNSEAGQNGYVYQSSYEATDTDQNGYVKLSSQEVPHTGQNSHVTLNSPEDPNTGPNSHVKLGSREDQNTGPNGYVKLGSQEDQNTCQNSHVELVSLGSANIDPAVYDSSSEKMADSVGSVEGSTPVPQQVMPPMAPPHSKVSSPVPQALAPPPKAYAVLPTGPSPPPAPKASPVNPSGPSPPPAPKAAPPPPPSKSAGPSPPPPAMPGSKTCPPPPLKKSGNKADADADSSEAKTKLKPFFWDKVAARANQSTVWDHLNKMGPK